MVIMMGSLLARLKRLEKAMTPKDGDVQVISTLMDELAGNAPVEEHMRRPLIAFHCADISFLRPQN